MHSPPFARRANYAPAIGIGRRESRAFGRLAPLEPDIATFPTGQSSMSGHGNGYACGRSQPPFFGTYLPEQGTRASETVIDGYRPNGPGPTCPAEHWRVVVTCEATAPFDDEITARRGFELSVEGQAVGTFPDGTRVRLEHYVAATGDWVTDGESPKGGH